MILISQEMNKGMRNLSDLRNLSELSEGGIPDVSKSNTMERKTVRIKDSCTTIYRKTIHLI